MSEQSTLVELIRKARRRHASHLLINQGIFAVTFALAGLVALLLFGTQVLNGVWIAILFGASFLVGLYRAKKRMKSPYQLAQRLDEHLQLHDSLSTAFYFTENGGGNRASEDIIEQQRVSAEQAARSVDLQMGLPFTMPRSSYAAAALAFVALSVFGLRYGVTRSLDLRPSLVQIAFNGLLGTEELASAKKKIANGKTKDGRPLEEGTHVDPWESKTLDAQGPSDDVLKTVDTPDVNNPNYNSEANAKAQGAPTPDPIQQPGEASDEGDKSATGSEQKADKNSAPDKEGGKQAKQQGGEQSDKQGNSSSDNSSLADKMRDALSNLMSKLKPQKPGDNKQSSQSQQGQQSAQRQKDEKGSPQQGKSQDAQSSQDQQGEQEGQSSDKSASAQNKSGSKSSDKPPTQDGKSGVGKEDGDKTAREAEQLAAMGKISELIGKRAANVQGEVMVEVSSGKQQLKTQYSQRKAAHADAGGELNRDEVPLAYQQYVQQYFEEIRKAPAAASGAAQAPKAKKPAGT